MARSERREDPPYLRIAAEIRARITAGTLRAGDRIPSTRQITQEWGVAKATATKVIDTLRSEGAVRTVPRVGTVVAGPPPAPVTRASDRDPPPSRIASAAIAIADEHGLAGLSMRGVASAVGLPTMSLYRHVQSKEALFDLMVDTAFGEVDLPAAPPEDWRTGLELAARLHWQVYRRHPWLPSLVSLTHPQLQPGLARCAEWTLRVVRRLGLDPVTGAMVHFLIADYVRGTATNLQLQAEMDQRTGLTGGQWVTAQLAALGPDSDEFPELLGAVARDPEFRIDLDHVFEFGLERVLDGVAALVRDRTP